MLWGRKVCDFFQLCIILKTPRRGLEKKEISKQTKKNNNDYTIKDIWNDIIIAKEISEVCLQNHLI